MASQRCALRSPDEDADICCLSPDRRGARGAPNYRSRAWLKAMSKWIAGYMERSDMCPVRSRYGRCLKDILLRGVLTDTLRVCPSLPETPCGVPGYLYGMAFSHGCGRAILISYNRRPQPDALPGGSAHPAHVAALHVRGYCNSASYRRYVSVCFWINVMMGASADRRLNHNEIARIENRAHQMADALYYLLCTLGIIRTR